MSQIEGGMHIWTDTPTATLWQNLRVFTFPANVRALLLGHLPDSKREPHTEDEDVTTVRAREVAACLRQADEYFAAARAVSFPTRPLVQYYGVLMLSKALVVLNVPAARLSNVKYHGLSTRASTARQSPDDSTELMQYSKDESRWTLAQEFAVTNDGVFKELVRFADQLEVPNGRVLRLGELLSMVTEISEVHNRTIGPSKCLRVYSVHDDWPRPHIYFQRPLDHAAVESLFPEFLTGHVAKEYHGQVGYERSDGTPTFVAGKLVKSVAGGQYLVRAHATGFVSSLPVMFACSFILADVVRYKPAFWMDCLEGAKSGTVGLAQLCSDTIERRFPQDVLSAIWGESVTLGAATYLI